MDEQRASLVVDPANWEKCRASQISILKAKGLKPEHKLLDLGCGVLVGGIASMEYLDTGNYWGLDNSDKRLEEAMKEVGDSGLIWKQPKPKLRLGYDEIKKEGIKFDYVWFHQVIIHMLDEVAQEVFHFISKVLADDGKCYITANIADENKTSYSTMKYPCEWDLVYRTEDFYKSIADNARLEVTAIEGDMITIQHKG